MPMAIEWIGRRPATTRWTSSNRSGGSMNAWQWHKAASIPGPAHTETGRLSSRKLLTTQNEASPMAAAPIASMNEAR